MKRKDCDHYVLDGEGGREIYANNGILGLQIDKDDSPGLLTHGYDGYVSSDFDSHGDEIDPLTSKERWEIAEYMINRWRKWAGLA